MATHTSPSADALPRLGQYRILRSIAAGGMGEIFLAKRVGPGGFEKLVALKRMLPHLMRDERSVAMFLNEAKLAAQLNHANIVQIYDFGRLGDTYFISMEFVHGKNLRDLLDRSVRTGIGIPVEHALGIIRDVCAGLGYAHQRSSYDGAPLEIIHRDVSPQNVLVSFEGEVKVTDFGIAKASLIASETTAGTVKGKLSYMSPEQISGQTLDQRSDLFSLGVILFELLTARKLFPDDVSLPETIDRIQRVDVPLPRDVNPAIPEEVEELVLRALARTRAERFQTARAMELAIIDVMTRLGLVSGNHERVLFLRELFSEPDAAATLASEIAALGITPTPGSAGPVQVSSGAGPLPGAPTVSLGRFALQALLVVVVFVAGAALLKRYVVTPERAGAVVTAVPPAAPGQGPGSSERPGGTAAVVPVPTPGVPATVTAASGKRHVEVTSSPSGAEIWVDGEDQHKATPAELELPIGRRSIRLEKDGYEPKTTAIAVDASAPGVAVDGPLVAKPVTVQIASDPPGALVSIGDMQFTAPQTATLKPGRYPVTVEKAGYATLHPPPVTIEPNRTMPLRYELTRASRTGVVNFNTEPWSMVYEEGKPEPIGQTPFYGYSTTAGVHRFRFVNPSVGLDEIVPIDVAADDEYKKPIRFESAVEVDPAVRELWIDDRPEQRRSFKLLVGSHKVRYRLADGTDSSTSIAVRNGQEVRLP